MSNVGIAIAHAAWADGRKETLSRLVKGIDARRHPLMLLSESREREHAGTWARRLWGAIAAHDAVSEAPDAWIVLNDDVFAAPNVHEHVSRMLTATSAPIIALHCNSPGAPSIMAAGHEWLRSYWVTGPGYVLRRGVAARLLAFADEHGAAAWEGNEDALMMRWLKSIGEPAWHCLPALVEHDTATRSTLGYDDHPMRQTLVPWHRPIVGAAQLPQLGERWQAPPAEAPPMIECPWYSTAQLDAWLAGRRPGRRRRQDAFARLAQSELPSVLIACVNFGQVTSETCASIAALVRATDAPCIVSDLMMQQAGMVRARARIVEHALQVAARDELDAVLLLDSDVVLAPRALAGMLGALSPERPFIACPYPRRDGASVNMRAKAGAKMQDDAHVIEIEAIGLGAALLSVRALGTVAAAHASVVPDGYQGAGERYYRLFAPIELHDEEGAETHLDDDYAFCTRWRAAGFAVHAYLGAGSPADHVGKACFRARLEEVVAGMSGEGGDAKGAVST